MFYRLGMKQLLKSKRVLALSVLAISLGVGILYTINISADTIQNAIEVRSNFLFGNVDYSVYRSDHIYYDNTSCGIPYNYTSTIRAMPGVDHVVARACASAGYYAPDDTTMYWNNIASIDVENPDEVDIGVANVTAYMPEIGTGTKKLEDLLNYTGVIRPVVISDLISYSKGISIGDTIRIIAVNATKAYATKNETDAAVTKEQKTMLDNDIRNNASRICQFTVVGILIDGSEGSEKPVFKEMQSLAGLSPIDECLYVRMNDSLEWIFNQNAGEVGFFLVDTSSSFSGGIGAFSGSVMTATGSANIVGLDIRAHFQTYIDYASVMMRVILSILTVAAWISCYVLIKTVVQMNLNEKMREIGVLRAVGFKKKAINEIVISQLLVMTALGVAAGLAIGLVPPNFFNVSTIAQFLSYNKSMAMESFGVVVSLLSTVISIVSGIILPLVSGMVPLRMARKWSIVQMMSPVYMQMKEVNDEYSTYPISIKNKARQRLVKAYGLVESAWIWQNAPHVAASLVDAEVTAWKGKVAEKLAKKARGRTAPAKKRRPRNAMSPKVAALWITILIASFVAFYLGATNIFKERGSFSVDLEAEWHVLLATLGGIFFLLVAVWQLSADQIGGVSSFFARMQRRMLGPISHFIPKSIHANTRNMKNLIGFLTLGVALVVSLTVMQDTIKVGNIAMNRSYFGGDMSVYSPFIPRSDLPSIRGIDGITGATVYTGVVMDSWNYNFDKAYSYVVNTADSYGGKHNNITENLNVVVIEPGEYLAMNQPGSSIHNEFSSFVPSVYEIDAPNVFESPSDFIHRLDQSMSVIIGTPLMTTLGKNVGDTIMVSINGFVAPLTIVGAATSLPAAPYMRLMDNAESKYMTRTMMISRSTLATMLGNFVGNVDIFVKNMTIPSRLMNHSVSNDAAGYTSGIINMTAVTSALSGISGIDHAAYRFSTFVPGAPSLNATYHASQLVWKHANVSATEGEEFPLPLRMYVVDGREDLFVTGAQERVVDSSAWTGMSFSPPPDNDVKSLLDWYYSKPINTTASNILYLIEHYLDASHRSTYYGNTSVCITNRYVAAYEDIDNETYVYEMKPMDKIKFSMELDNGTIKSFNFTVAATLDNHVSYWWQNGSMREGFKLSSKSLNYNFKANESSGLQDLFDVDANVFLTTRSELVYLATKLFGGLAQFIGIEGLDGLKASEIANHVEIKVKPGYNVTYIVNQIHAALNARYGSLANFSIIEYKRAFIDKIANTGSLAVNIEPSVPEGTIVARLGAWYASRGYKWNVAHVGTLERQNLGADIGVVDPVFQVFFVVAIFSLLISAVGLCTILYANARKRHREFGIYKALGYTSTSIRRMIFFETFIVTSIGIVAGAVAGLAMMGVLYQAIRSSIVIPMLFSIPIWTLSIMVASLLVIAAITSDVIAKHFTRLSTVEIIRYRE